MLGWCSLLTLISTFPIKLCGEGNSVPLKLASYINLSSKRQGIICSYVIEASIEIFSIIRKIIDCLISRTKIPADIDIAQKNINKLIVLIIIIIIIMKGKLEKQTKVNNTKQNTK